MTYSYKKFNKYPLFMDFCESSNYANVKMFFSTVPGYDEPAHWEGENETEGAAKVALC
jgi:hypothetical protein